MKKITWLWAFIFLLFFYSTTTAQTDSSASKTTGYLSFNFGMSLPVGTFSSTTTANPGTFASRGTSTFLSAGIIISKLKFGFAIKEGWYECGFDPNGYIKAAQAADSLPNRTFNRQGSDAKYYGGYGMIGLITDLKIHNLTLEFELMGGRLTAIFPEVIYSVTSSTGSVSAPYDFASTEVGAFAFEGGINGRLPIYKHFCIMVEFTYLYSSLLYATVEQYTNSAGVITSQNIYYTCQLSFISGTAGIAFRF
jgi:hypothetical protein